MSNTLKALGFHRGTIITRAVGGSEFPWGSGPAPTLRCDQCHHRIGKTAYHLILDDGTTLLCEGCLNYCNGHPHPPACFMHDKYAPQCPHGEWHDMFDHVHEVATRASAWFSLPSPETKQWVRRGSKP